jgi:hypothetical protein
MELNPKFVENQHAPQVAPTVNITLDINELNVILTSLQELPHRVVDLLLKKLFQQAQAQLEQSKA